MRTRLFPLRLYLLLLIVVATNSVLWLDSLENYFTNREHIQLSTLLPSWLFIPSNTLHATSVFQPPSINPVKEKSPSGLFETITQEHATPDKLELPPKILFAGDSLMQGVAPLAISELKKLYPNGKFVDLSQQSTGLTAKRYFDWPKKIQEESLKQGFNTIVIFLGPNDPWDIYEGNNHYVFPSPQWEEAYRARVLEVLQFAKEHHIHVIWVGLPNMDVERVKTGAIIQNKVFEAETKKMQFDFISTEPIIGALDAPFKKYLEDPQKGMILLRGNDGVHFTVHGYRLMSEPIIQKIKDKF